MVNFDMRIQSNMSAISNVNKPVKSSFGQCPRLFLVIALFGSQIQGANVFSVQDDVEIAELLQQASSAQTSAASRYRTFTGFRFTDRLPQSGITFTHKMTEDSGRAEKAVHYDHGSAVALADVDGDGLPDIFFGNQIGGNELWQNLGAGRFQKITTATPVALSHAVTVGAGFADLDNDGDPDLMVTTVREGTFLFENTGKGNFRDITAAAGIHLKGHSSGVAFLDFDRDGQLDVFITNVGRFTSDQKGPGGYYIGLTNAFSGHLFAERHERPFLLRNEGRLKFREMAAEMNIGYCGWNGDAQVCDINGDGFPDLYVLNMQGDDRLLANQGGKRFEDQTGRFFPKTPWGAMGVALLDFNQDGAFDFALTDMHSDMTSGQNRQRGRFNSSVEKAKAEAWCTAQWSDAFLQGASNNIFGNAFYFATSTIPFLEVSDRVDAETFWPWGISAGDLNADGYEDLFVSAGMGYPFAYAINNVLLNENGKIFRPSEFIVGVEPRREGRVSKACFTLETSGADKDHPLARGRTGTLEVRSSLSTRSSAFADLDADGDLDIVTNEFDDVPQILISNLAEQRNIGYLLVKLIGRKSNRDGIGATIRVKAGPLSLHRYHSGKGGYLQVSSLPVYFGLGNASKVDEVEITWPSGVTQHVTDGLGLSRVLIVEERP